MSSSARQNRMIWVAVLAALAVVLSIGAWVYSTVETPVERPWDYGAVRFVPGRSHYSTHRVDAPPLPDPAATQPRPGGSR